VIASASPLKEHAMNPHEIMKALETEQGAVRLAKAVSSGAIPSPLSEPAWNTVIEEQAKAHFPECDEGMGWSQMRTIRAVGKFASTPTGAALMKACTAAKFGKAVIPEPRPEEPVHKYERQANEHPIVSEIQRRADVLYEGGSPQQRFARALEKDALAKSLFRVIQHGAAMTDANVEKYDGSYGAVVVENNPNVGIASTPRSAIAPSRGGHAFEAEARELDRGRRRRNAAAMKPNITPRGGDPSSDEEDEVTEAPPEGVANPYPKSPRAKERSRKAYLALAGGANWPAI
jgi:hypothetical protein